MAFPAASLARLAPLPWHALARIAPELDGPLRAVLQGCAAERELDRFLRAHRNLAREERAAGVYGLVGAKAPGQRAQLAALMDEHRRILDALADLLERRRGPDAAASEIARRTGELAAMLRAHHARELEVARVLA